MKECVVECRRDAEMGCSNEGEGRRSEDVMTEEDQGAWVVETVQDGGGTRAAQSSASESRLNQDCLTS